MEAAHVGTDLSDHGLSGAPLRAGDGAEQPNRRDERGEPLSIASESRSAARRGSRDGRGSRRPAARAARLSGRRAPRAGRGPSRAAWPLASSASTWGSLVPDTSASSIARSLRHQVERTGRDDPGQGFDQRDTGSGRRQHDEPGRLSRPAREGQDAAGSARLRQRPVLRGHKPREHELAVGVHAQERRSQRLRARGVLRGRHRSRRPVDQPRERVLLELPRRDALVAVDRRGAEGLRPRRLRLLWCDTRHEPSNKTSYEVAGASPTDKATISVSSSGKRLSSSDSSGWQPSNG